MLVKKIIPEQGRRTPPHFYEVFYLKQRKPHPSGCCRYSPTLSRLRLGWALFLFCLISLTSTSLVSASDLAKEKRWAEQISDSLLDGEAIQLSNGSHDFLAIETHAEDASELGVIILHGIGIHPDWPAVIQPLRVELAEAGWNTLSLQMPVLKNEAEANEYEPLLKEVPNRIDAGIRHLAQQGVNKIAIIAHSMGARMASYYLANKKVYQEAQTETPIVVYVSIGMGVDDKNLLGKVRIPVFDIYGEKDLPEVISSAPDRKKAYAGNKAYKQIKVTEADHFFDDQNEALLKVVKQAISNF